MSLTIDRFGLGAGLFQLAPAGAPRRVVFENFLDNA